MASISLGAGRWGRWMRHIGRGLALLWAGWWCFFGLASGLSEGLTAAGVLVHTAVPGLVFLVSAFVPWRWEALGAVLLLVEGIVVLIAYPVMVSGRFPLSTIVFVSLTMALPPLVAGVLLLADWRRGRTDAVRRAGAGGAAGGKQA
jgi:hypothetical protein